MKGQESLARIKDMCQVLPKVEQQLNEWLIENANKVNPSKISLDTQYWGKSTWMTYLFNMQGKYPMIGCIRDPDNAKHALITNFSPRCLNFSDINLPENPSFEGGFTLRELDQMAETCGNDMGYAIVYNPNSVHYFGLELPQNMMNVIRGLIVVGLSLAQDVYNEVVNTDFTDDTLKNLSRFDMVKDNKKRIAEAAAAAERSQAAGNKSRSSEPIANAPKRRKVMPRFYSDMERIYTKLQAIDQQSLSQPSCRGGAAKMKSALKEQEGKLIEEMKRYYITEQKQFFDEHPVEDDNGVPDDEAETYI